MENFEFINGDCLKYLKEQPDNRFDLAIVDPPYGLDKKSMNGAGKLKSRAIQQNTDWDIAPTKEYFDQLFRVSKNQIIWGGNYFDLPPTRGFVIWDKLQPFPNFSRCEYAWLSMQKPSKLFAFDNRTGGKIHPTQKPIKLYEWLLKNYALKGNKILDTHLGSGSHAIAVKRMNQIDNMDLKFVGIEINEKYFNDFKQRFSQETRQKTIFD